MSSLVLVLVGAVTCVAQPVPAGMKVGLSMYLQAGYGGLKSELSEAADMPVRWNLHGDLPCRACAARTHVYPVDEKEKREDLDADVGMQRRFRRQPSTTRTGR